MLTKAAVLYEEGSPLVIEDIELQDPKRGEVLIKVGAAGVCRSDLHFMKGHAHFKLPVLLGHEGSGTVEAVGPDVTKVKPGDRVILSFVPNCGFCHYCETGRPHLCDTAIRVNAGVMMDGTSRHFTRAPGRPSPTWVRSPALPITPWSPRAAAFRWGTISVWSRRRSSAVR